jgi:hypothetical protein
MLARATHEGEGALVETHTGPEQRSVSPVAPPSPRGDDASRGGAIAEASVPGDLLPDETTSDASHAGSMDPVPVGPDPVDLVKLEEARDNVRAALIAAAPALESQGIASFLARFDADTVDLAREKWPLVRLVEPLVADQDARTSVAAMRWLGRRGDALSARRIAAALDDPARKSEAAAALVDSGPSGRDMLVGTMRDEELRAFVLDELTARDPQEAVYVLVKSTRTGSQPLDVRIALEWVVQRGLTPATPWVEDLVRERGDDATADLAVRALVSLGSPEALLALLRLREGPARQEAIDAAIARLLASFEDSAATLARELIASRRGRELRALHDALLAVPSPSIVPALIVLASSSQLSLADRRFVILLAAEQANSEHVAALIDLFRRLDRRDRSLKAAALVAIHALGGRAATADAMSDLPRGTRERALSVLDGVGASLRPETTLLQLSRELEPKLSPLQL